MDARNETGDVERIAEPANARYGVPPPEICDVSPSKTTLSRSQTMTDEAKHADDSLDNGGLSTSSGREAPSDVGGSARNCGIAFLVFVVVAAVNGFGIVTGAAIDTFQAGCLIVAIVYFELATRGRTNLTAVAVYSAIWLALFCGMFLVVPQFKQIFSDCDTTLPASTALLFFDIRLGCPKRLPASVPPGPGACTRRVRLCRSTRAPSCERQEVLVCVDDRSTCASDSRVASCHCLASGSAYY
jgi:hypothetical protein